MELLFVPTKVFLKYCEKLKGVGAEILKKGRVLQKLWHSAKVKLWCVLLFKLWCMLLVLSSFPSTLLCPRSQKGQKSCEPLFLQWENLEQKSVHQYKFSLFLPDINLSLSEHCTSVQNLLLWATVLLWQRSTTGDKQGPELLGVRFLNDFVFASSQFISSWCSRPVTVSDPLGLLSSCNSFS